MVRQSDESPLTCLLQSQVLSLTELKFPRYSRFGLAVLRLLRLFSSLLFMVSSLPASLQQQGYRVSAYRSADFGLYAKSKTPSKLNNTLRNFESLRPSTKSPALTECLTPVLR